MSMASSAAVIMLLIIFSVFAVSSVARSKPKGNASEKYLEDRVTGDKNTQEMEKNVGVRHHFLHDISCSTMTEIKLIKDVTTMARCSFMRRDSTSSIRISLCEFLSCCAWRPSSMRALPETKRS